MIFQVWHISAFLENNPNKFLHVNKVESLSFLTVCSYHVTYASQSESTLYICLNVKELLARYLKFKWLQRDSNPQPLPQPLPLSNHYHFLTHNHFLMISIPFCIRKGNKKHYSFKTACRNTAFYPKSFTISRISWLEYLTVTNLPYYFYIINFGLWEKF